MRIFSIIPFFFVFFNSLLWRVRLRSSQKAIHKAKIAKRKIKHLRHFSIILARASDSGHVIYLDMNDGAFEFVHICNCVIRLAV